MNTIPHKLVFIISVIILVLLASVFYAGNNHDVTHQQALDVVFDVLKHK